MWSWLRDEPQAPELEIVEEELGAFTLKMCIYYMGRNMRLKILFQTWKILHTMKLKITNELMVDSGDSNEDDYEWVPISIVTYLLSYLSVLLFFIYYHDYFDLLLL